MSLSAPVTLLAFAGLALLAGSAAAQTAGRTAIMFEDFPGGTGGSVAKLLRESLERSGRFTVTATAGWHVRASSSAGRIDGALIASNGKVLFNNHYDWPDLRDNAASFSDDIVEAVTGGTGIATSKIAFVSDRTGHKEIWVCDSDGERAQQITRDGSVSVSPSLARTSAGTLLVHTGYASGFPDVYVTSLSDGNRQRIISAPGTNSGAAFSADGSRIALTMSHEGDPEIYVTTINGGRSQRLTESRSVEFSPAWAPDGERIVFCSDATGAPQLYVVPRKGGSPERLATGAARCTDPDWNADGRLIAFTSWNGNSRSVAVYELETGRTQTVLTGASDPSWGPDGRHFVAVQGGELVVFDVTTGKKEKIVTGMGRISEPSWSK